MKHLILFFAVGGASFLSADQYPGQTGGHYDQTGRYHCAGCTGSDAFYQDLSGHPGTYQDGNQNNYSQQNLNRANLGNPNQPYYQATNPNLQNSYGPSSSSYFQQNRNLPNNPNSSFSSSKDAYGRPIQNPGYFQNQGSSYDQSFETARSTQPTDREIEQEIRDDLSPGWFSKGFESVTFQVLNGNVTLRGTVETNEDKDDIEDSVKDIDGVKNVNNQIIVTGKKSSKLYSKNPYAANEALSSKTTLTDRSKYAQDFAATDSDRILNAKIRDRLKNGWFTKGYEALIIKTSNGVVTIIGAVDNEKDIPKVTDEIKKVEGVKKVNAQLSVKHR